MAGSGSSHLSEPLPRDACLIIGAGHFGHRAIKLLSEESRPLLVVDVNEACLAGAGGPGLRWIPCDGIRFLVNNHHLLNPGNIIVPAIPLHLAFEWLKRYLGEKYKVEKISVPPEARGPLPHTWEGSEGSLLVSYADFVCPDNCPEPEYCTVTGERRDRPLFQLLRNLTLPGFRTLVIRSHQLAPGLGGYKVADLTDAAARVAQGGAGKWLLGSACRCHGVLTAMEVRPVEYT